MDKNEEGTQELKYEGQLFTKRPEVPDASKGKLFLRLMITFGPAIALGYWFWMHQMAIVQIIHTCSTSSGDYSNSSRNGSWGASNAMHDHLLILLKACHRNHYHDLAGRPRLPKT